MGGPEVVCADDSLRPVGGRGNPCDGDGRGIAGNDAIGSDDRFDGCEHFLLRADVFGDGFDDAFHPVEVRIVRREMDAAQPGFGLCRTDAPSIDI